MEGLLYWIWLSLCCTPNSKTFKKLLSEFRSAEDVYKADKERISDIIGSKSRDLRALCDKDIKPSEKILDFCTKKKVSILTYFDERFPESLREIDTPPVLLYYRGILPDFKASFCISVVGTRRLSEYGRRVAFYFSHDLARAGATIVSGMAIGIDGVALSAAAGCGYQTVAVIGSGIDVCYPKEHKRLAQEIVKSGCVFTEYPPGTKPDKHNFPARNRIISGLSKATLVVEGREKSGALITARFCKEQGRRLYAIPGNVLSKTSELSNLLIKNGASLCTAADDIIRDFEEESMGILNSFKLSEDVKVDMNEVFERLSVSCVAQSDGFFNPFKRWKERNAQKSAPKDKASPDIEPSEKKSEPDFKGIDKKSIEIYYRIPEGAACRIESLCDEQTDIRRVMRILLNLEVGRFVVMLPGEKVRRNF